MKASKDVILKIVEVFKDQKTADEINQAPNVEEAYKIACVHMAGVTQEEFLEALSTLQECDGQLELSEEELDVVAGGAVAASSVEWSSTTKWTSSNN